MSDNVDNLPAIRRTPLLAVLGVIALGVAAWGLTGGPEIPSLNPLLPWILIGVGVVAGVVLIASGFRRRDDS